MAAATAVADRNLKPYCEDILVWCWSVPCCNQMLWELPSWDSNILPFFFFLSKKHNIFKTFFPTQKDPMQKSHSFSMQYIWLFHIAIKAKYKFPTCKNVGFCCWLLSCINWTKKDLKSFNFLFFIYTQKSFNLVLAIVAGSRERKDFSVRTPFDSLYTI